MRTEDIAAIWDRTEPKQRSGPAPLSRKQIVQSAIVLADKSGLEAVTLRNVGEACGTSAMRLYTFVQTKEELMELLIDQVYAEIRLPKKSTLPWHDQLRWFAKTMFTIGHKHPWFSEILGGRPHLGPNSLRFLEHLLEVLLRSGKFADVGAVFQALWSMHAFLLGALRSEAMEARQRKDSGLTRKQWEAKLAPYLERQIASGDLPCTMKVVTEVHSSFEDRYRDGVEVIIEGIGSKYALIRPTD